MAYNKWNTNFTYGEELTSPNMNSSLVGFLKPGVYNSNIYFDITDTGMKLVIGKGTIIVFSHVKSEKDYSPVLESSYDVCTKCVATDDNEYTVFGNGMTSSILDEVKSILSNDIVFVYAMKKVSKAADNTDEYPYVGLLSFYTDTTGSIKTRESIVPNINGASYSSDSNWYYQILGVVLRKSGTFSNGDFSESSNSVSTTWINNHTFTTRCLPSYTQSSQYTDSFENSSIYYNYDSNHQRLLFNYTLTKAFINNVLYNYDIDWTKLYGWNDLTSEVDTTAYITKLNVINVDLAKDGTSSDSSFYMTLLYTVLNNSEVCGTSDSSSLKRAFSIMKKPTIKDLSFKISFNSSDDSDLNNFVSYLSNRCSKSMTGHSYLYTDSSKDNVSRLMSILYNRNLLPYIYDYIRYNEDYSGSERTTIVPIAISFDSELKTNIEPVNTLCLFDIQSGDNKINDCIFNFQSADIIPALGDEE